MQGPLPQPSWVRSAPGVARSPLPRPASPWGHVRKHRPAQPTLTQLVFRPSPSGDHGHQQPIHLSPPPAPSLQASPPVCPAGPTGTYRACTHARWHRSLPSAGPGCLPLARSLSLETPAAPGRLPAPGLLGAPAHFLPTQPGRVPSLWQGVPSTAVWVVGQWQLACCAQ